MQLMYPWFLGGLLAVAIPIIIHLLQLRRPQRILFSNTSFIKEVELVTVRHRVVQQWLILATRILGITALVIAFCQPFIPIENTVRAITRNEVTVLIDNSFSMQQHGTAQTLLFREAVDEARTFGQSMPTGAKIRLRNNGSTLMTATTYQVKLNKLKLSSSNFQTVLNTLKESEYSGENSLYVFSDFQKNTIDAGFVKGLGKNREVVLVPFMGQRVENVYVDSVWLEDAIVRVRANVGLHVRFRNGGDVGAADCPVKVFLGTRQVASFRVTVEPGQTVASVVQVQVNDGALVLGRVVTEDTPVAFDNTYYFTLQPAEPIRVLEIAGEPVAQQLYGNEPLFTYTFARPQDLDYGALRQANLVLVREVNIIDAGLRDGLRAVLKRGGSVVIVPSGVAAGQAAYQHLFRDLGLGTVQWEAQTAVPELREVAMPNAREPFFRDVFGAQQRAVTMPRVAPVLRWSRTGTDILRLQDGESYLADFESGKGRVYVFSAPFTKAYSDFTTHALFVPVMYRMAMLSYRNEQQLAYRLAQTTVALKLPASTDVASGTAERADEAGFKLVKDSLTFIPAQRMLGQEARLDVPKGMNEPGFYQVQRHGKVLTTLAFNQDKRESELAAYSADELRAMIGPNRPNIRVLEGGADGAKLAKFRAEQMGQPLWRYFLALVLACLLAEALLVRFGGARARQLKAKLAA